MTCDLSKERLIGFYYDEVDPVERREIQAHLETCPACREELEALGQTTGVLRAWPDEEPDMDLVFVRDREPFWRSLIPDWLSDGGWRRFAGGMALGAAAAVVLLALLNVQVGFTDGTLSLNVGLRGTPEQPSPADPLPRPVTLAEFADYQDQSLSLIRDLLENAETRQRRDIGLALARFADDLDQQRQRDLQLVGLGLQDVERSTSHRLNQIGQLIALTAQDSYPVRGGGTE